MKYVMRKIDTTFTKELEEIAVERIRRKKDNQLRSPRRLTKAIHKLSYWDKIKEDLINANIEEDRWK